MMQHSPSANLLLLTGKGFFNIAGGFRGGRPRSTTRAQDRRGTQFLRQGNREKTKVRCSSSTRIRSVKSCGEVWKTLAEEEERFQRTKEEAWKLFERQPWFEWKTRDEFEEDFARKVRKAMSNSREEQEKTVQKWSGEMQRSGDARPGREREWNRRFPFPKNNEHGRKYGDRGSSSHRRCLRHGTELRRQGGRRARCTGLLSGDNLMLRIPRSKWVLTNSLWSVPWLARVSRKWCPT